MSASRYAVDFSGWIYVDAASEQEASQKASDILSAAFPQDFHGGDWELSGVEVEASDD